jgi:hypothetical protein
MIHRQYVCKLSSSIEGFPFLDIMVQMGGSYAAPVNNPALFAGIGTAAPAAWQAVCGANWYYEARSRILRLEHLAAAGAAAGFTPRGRLGAQISIVRLENSVPVAPVPGGIPAISASASLAVNPISNVALGAEIGAFADPAYGPVIRLHNSADLFGERQQVGIYFLVSLGLAENQDEDGSNLGFAT